MQGGVVARQCGSVLIQLKAVDHLKKLRPPLKLSRTLRAAQGRDRRGGHRWRHRLLHHLIDNLLDALVVLRRAGCLG